MKLNSLKENRCKISISIVLLTIILSLSTTAYSKEPIKVCAITGLTGIFAPVGQSQLEGTKVAAMHINEDGGILGRKVIIVEKDSQVSAANALKIAREAAMNEDIKFFTGTISSSVALALTPLMEQLDSILLTTAAASSKVTGTKCNPHVFRISINAVSHHRSAAQLAYEKYPDVKKWAAIEPDYTFGHEVWEYFSTELKKLNPEMTIVAEAFPKFMAKNYEPFIMKLIEAKPEGIHCSLYSGDFVNFAKQAERFGLFKSVKVFINPIVELDVARTLGKDMPELWGSAHYYYDAYDNPMNKKFIEGYRKLYGADKFPIFAASEGYSALYALKHAIEKANSTETKAVIKALRGLSFETPTGTRYIRPEDHQTITRNIFLHFKPASTAPGWQINDRKVIWQKPFLPNPDEPYGGCEMKW